ncbi:NADPH-cytochrome P450 reductase, putative [Phytophthora infestans T30-4]|uniref:NADPH-cytochrome P450 reductase, putative n=1 Tax=Phytophthora infestans (strain T30-4) TaxID=403677 RepID=D0NEH9_PHYIT|nr:NADPH-cytochrome P450 reductase, putative [Phytophthora infestans T30-4]EEY56624.1 NADPH-cytochrome P450 reductase, putative [Phytophthora infestans T30-4]|eukprot:XP_002902698.1 NADPH-cytochrome P450 reductase, putative [Phytophthora infestans T30-4]
MTDSYVVVGSLLAMLATAVLFLREPKPKKDKLAEEMLRIGQQMKMYKEAAEPAPSVQQPSVEESPAYPGGRVAILFGSQTGTAEGFAEVLKAEGRKAGFQTHAIDLEDYDAASKLKDEKLVIFIMATYGEGDPTDNAVDFIDFLKDKAGNLEPKTFDSVHFTVFGLGNTQYEHYNEMGRMTDRFMEKYGAERVFHYGEGDDDASLDEDFDDWKEPLWRALRKQFIAGNSEEDTEVKQDEHKLTPPEYEYELVEIRKKQVENAPKEVKMKASTKHFFTANQAKVVVNRELRLSTAGGSTVHVELDLRGTGVTYETADNLAVLPENETRVVESLATRLDLDLDQWVALKPVAEDLHCELPFPSPSTIEDILTRYLAINSAPRHEGMKTPQSNVCIVERALFLWQEKHLQFAYEYYYTLHADRVRYLAARAVTYKPLGVTMQLATYVRKVLRWGLQTLDTFLNGDAPGTIWCDQDDKLLKNSMDLQPVSELTVADAKRLGVFEGLKA